MRRKTRMKNMAPKSELYREFDEKQIASSIDKNVKNGYINFKRRNHDV